MTRHDRLRMHKTRDLAEDARAEDTYVSSFYHIALDVDIVRGHIRTVVPNPSCLTWLGPDYRKGQGTFVTQVLQMSDYKVSRV
jgi:hypothetical protein